MQGSNQRRISAKLSLRWNNEPEAGRIFLAEARAVIQRIAEAVQTVKAVSNGKKGELHLGYAPSLTIKLLPQALRLFQEEVEGMRVVLHDFSTEEMLAGLREGVLQIALLKRPSDKSLRGLVYEELSRSPVCVAHESNPSARSDAKSKPGLPRRRTNHRLLAQRVSRISRMVGIAVRAA